MRKDAPQNLAASVRQRLQNLARQRQEDFQLVLGMANSRMKDFFDLWMLAEQFEFDGVVLARAIQATFDRRRTPLPHAVPLALTDEFCADRAKQSQWRAFTAKGNLATTAPSLSELPGILRLFLCPPMEAVRAALAFRQRWKPAGPWRE